MDTNAYGEVFQSMSQRAAGSYWKALADFTFVMPEGFAADRWGEMETAERDLYGFFQAFYAELFAQPELFGLPSGADDAIAEDETNPKDKKQEVKKKLDRPKNLITRGLDFLMAAGKNGALEGQTLIIPVEEYAAFARKNKAGRAFLKGMECAGLVAREDGATAVLRNARFPAMMLALKMLAGRCADDPNTNMGCFNFTRCDFRAFQAGYQPDPVDVFRVFQPANAARLAAMHRFWMEEGYKTEWAIYSFMGWELKYQGNKKIKNTPMFQIQFDDRYRNPLRLYVKCVSTSRIAPLIARHPRLLQEDFARRVNNCGDCGWCRNQKTLGPTTLELDGTTRKICWYTSPDVLELSDDTVELMKQYHALHQELLPAG